MMKYFSVITLLVVMTVACSKKDKEELTNLQAQVEALQKENASLKSGEKKLKNSISEYNKFLSDIENNLAEINSSKEMVAKLNKEVKSNNEMAKGIRGHITSIKALMENSRLKLVTMDKSMNKLRKESNEKSDDILVLDRKIKGLAQNLLDKDAEIEMLDNELTEMEELYQLEVMSAAELKAIINRGYFISASEKQLKSLGIVTNEGGFIGIGKVKVIKATSPDSLFIEIKKDQFTEVLIGAKKMKLITSHPEGSYELINNGLKVEKIIVLDPKAFWKNGNYLVIQADK